MNHAERDAIDSIQQRMWCLAQRLAAAGLADWSNQLQAIAIDATALRRGEHAQARVPAPNSNVIQIGRRA